VHQSATEEDWTRLGIDAAVGVGLILALALVFALDRGPATKPAGLSEESSEVESPATDGAVGPARPLRLAVTEPEYDDMGRLLDTLGAGYRYTTIRQEDLLDPSRLAAYDVVFLTCGGAPREWLSERTGPSERGGSGVFQARPEILDQIRTSLRQFVGRGGTLYASDWRIELLAIAFPEFVDRYAMDKGMVQTVEAEVVDAGLRRRLGPTIGLRFDQPSWRPAAIAGPEARTYLQGTYENLDGRRLAAPLLVTFPFQEGMVVFTSFHNEAQNTETELELLRYLVFTTVTAREEAKIKQTMLRGGLSPKERSLLAATGGGEPIEESYRCQTRGRLQFVLGFEDQGGRLKLEVTAPDGRRYEKTGTSTLSIEIADAMPGTWRYSVTPLEVPYRNFPFTLTVGEEP